MSEAYRPLKSIDKATPVSYNKVTLVSLAAEVTLGIKGEETKEKIRNQAYMLFASKGFKDVTMKDICEATGLSRGGLYRHYGSTGQIFRDILISLLTVQDNEFQQKIDENIPAVKILDDVLNAYKAEMLDAENSLSLAIYEYFSSEEIKEGNLLEKQYHSSFDSWNTLIQYGVSRGEFRKVNVRSVFDLLIFAYQGVRMYSSLVNMEADIPERIIDQVKILILPDK